MKSKKKKSLIDVASRQLLSNDQQAQLKGEDIVVDDLIDGI